MVVATVRLDKINYVEPIGLSFLCVRETEVKPLRHGHRRAMVILQIKIIFEFIDLGHFV